MDLKQVKIENYRSIQDAELVDCQEFNVLIGRNNSGKSNILVGMEGFFHSLKSGTIINLDPRIGDDHDFHDGVIENSIAVTCGFTLSSKERKEIIDEIASEQPQANAALAAVQDEVQLQIRIIFFSRPLKFSVVERIDLISAKSDIAYNLLVVKREAAIELYGIASEIRKTERIKDATEKFARGG